MGLKRKMRVKFGYIEKKPYLCTVLVAERLRSDNPAIAPRRRLIRGELAVSGAPLAAGAFVLIPKTILIWQNVTLNSERLVAMTQA